MQRRELITLLGGAAVAWPLAAQAQRSDRIRRVGVLSFNPNDLDWQSRIKAFRDGLAALGWVEGRNFLVDVRGVGGNLSQVGALAAELVAASPDVILAATPHVLAALRKETRTIPLVFVNVSDPVEAGFVESMARPGGNTTGFTSFEYSLGGKWLELLKEAMPALQRALVLLNPDNYTSRALLRTIESVAPVARASVTSAAVRNAREIESAIDAFAREPNGGMILLPDPVMQINQERIIELAILRRLPAIHQNLFFPQAGGLMSYGTDFVDVYRRAAGYVDRILKGAKVGELPVQNPVKYELVINLKIARTIGLEVPPMLLARADVVIE
jgi:putative ABC transport system substrate-binding protein